MKVHFRGAFEVSGLILLISTKGRSLYRMDTKWLNLLFGHDMVRS